VSCLAPASPGKGSLAPLEHFAEFGGEFIEGVSLPAELSSALQDVDWTIFVADWLTLAMSWLCCSNAACRW